MNMAIFGGIFEQTSTTTTIMPSKFLICIFSSLVLGLIISLTHKYKNRPSKNFIMTLAILPAIVCAVIMMVNGNVGAGVAVAGAFSLVRFRSVAGSSTDIAAIFSAMCIGLMTGMGYIAYAILFTFIICAMQLLYINIGIGSKKDANTDKTLRITIPEDLDYSGVFNDLFEKYTTNYEVINVKTTDMGSLFKLTYNLTLKNSKEEKEFIDYLRCRNGNLEISISRQETNLEL